VGGVGRDGHAQATREEHGDRVAHVFEDRAEVDFGVDRAPQGCRDEQANDQVRGSLEPGDLASDGVRDGSDDCGFGPLEDRGERRALLRRNIGALVTDGDEQPHQLGSLLDDFAETVDRPLESLGRIARGAESPGDLFDPVPRDALERGGQQAFLVAEVPVEGGLDRIRVPTDGFDARRGVATLRDQLDRSLEQALAARGALCGPGGMARSAQDRGLQGIPQGPGAPGPGGTDSLRISVALAGAGGGRLISCGAMATAPSDVIPVRPDEGFDTQALQAWLATRVEGADNALEVAQFAGGHANLTYLLQFGTGESQREYVLRRPPLGPVAPGSHDMEREYRALSVLWQGFAPAPRAYAYCDDESVIGAPFLVMERRTGVVVRSGVPDCYGGGADPGANRKMSEVVIDVLADFHSVDPVKIGLESLGRDPARFMERQVEGWAGRYERARTRDVPLAEELVAWLRAERPPTGDVTLLHNDWRLDNMALDAKDPGRCVAVFDWDMCTVGDPLADLGTVLSLWSNRGEAPAGTNPMPTQAEGFMSREEAVARYGEKTGRDVSRASWYDVFGTFKMAVVLQQIYYRFEQGQTQDSRFAGLADAAEGLFRLAASRRP